MPPARILVIRLGALGNVILSLDAFAAIRAHHPEAEITLLTTRPYAGWLAQSPYFDRVEIDRRPAGWDLPGIWRLARQLRAPHYRRVYDLQTSGRSSRYFLLFAGQRVEWSGIARGASHPDSDPRRNFLHDIERQAGQLRQAGVAPAKASLDWVRADLSRFALPARYALLVPGASAHRPEKRWPAAQFQALAAALLADGITPVLLGTAIEAAATHAIAAAVPGAIDLAGQTNLGELVAIGRHAKVSVGNDTGPMHMLAAAGSPALVLFSDASDPALCAPRGPVVAIRQTPDLADLPPGPVIAAARLLASGVTSV